MILKKHFNSRRLILAVCDEELLGKKFEDKDMILDLSSDFYKGEMIFDKELIAVVKTAYIINAVGNNSVRCLIKEGLVSGSDVKKINDIPYTMLVFEGKNS